MAGQGSARVTLKEIDLSQVRDPEQLPQGVPAAVVGPAKRGPAFVPKTFATIQQFEETFGSLRQIDRESNANRFGPLALNEWMRNAEAGTFLRVLGVGSETGKKDSSGFVTGAGFVVGDKVSHDANNKLRNNPHAEITSTHVVGSTLAGRTHFLGCFMKDQGASTFLQDSGVQTASGNGQLKIEINSTNGIPADGDTIQLKYVKADNTIVTKTFEFDTNNSVTGANIRVDINGKDLAQIATEIKNQIRANDEGALDSISIVGNAGQNPQAITINQTESGEITNTEVTFNINPANKDDFRVGGKSSSTASQNFSYAQTGAIGAKFDVRIQNNPVSGNLAFYAVNNDKDGTLTSAAPQKVTYTFSSVATDFEVADTGTDGVANRYAVTGGAAVKVYSGGTKQQTLLNLKAAIDRSETTGHTLQHKDMFITSLSADGLTLSVTQVNKGKAGNSQSNLTANIELGAVGASTITIDCASNIGGTPTTIAQSSTGFMIGGADGTSSSFTMKLSDNLNADDTIKLFNINVAGTTNSYTDDVPESEEYIIKTAGTNGALTGGDKIIVLKGFDLQETLYNLRSAILAGSGDPLLEVQADSSIRVNDGDAPHGVNAGQKITLISTDKTRVEYIVSLTDGAGNNLPHLTSVTNNTGDLGGGVAPSVNALSTRAIAVGVPNNTKRQGFLVLLKAAIEHANGHGGKIIVGAVPGEADGNIDVTLTQLTPGSDGNTTITENIDNFSRVSNFTGGTNGFNASKITVSDVDDSITFTLDQNISLKTELENTVKVSEAATFSNPANQTLTGNRGQKTTTFTGGGGSAVPVVRGILMTPQGVVPALDTDSGSYLGLSDSFTESTHLRIEVGSTNSLRAFGTTKGTSLVGYELGKISSNSFTLFLNGFTNSAEPAILTCSFDPDSPNYFSKVLNTDPEKIEERGHYLYASWDIDTSVSNADVTGILDNSSAAISAANAGAFCMRSTAARGADLPNTPDFERFDTRFRTAKSPWIKSQKFGGSSVKLFKLHSLDDGSVGNDRFRILISDIRAGETSQDYGFFTLTLESFYSDPVSGEALIQWKNLTLDPDSRNFIGRVIGDKHMYYDFDRDLSKQRLVEEGMFEVRNKYVRVELSDAVMLGEVPVTSLPCGFAEYKTLNLQSKSGLFDDSGTLVNLAALNRMSVLPLPFVKTITRGSTSPEASDRLAWGVKFGSKKSAADHNELSEIRFNDSIKSWTKYYPDLGTTTSKQFAIDSSEEFTLENIVLTSFSDYSSLDWSTSEYARKGSFGGKTNIDLSEAAKVGKNIRYLKFRCLMQGGFDGVNIFNKDKSAMNSAAAFREANEETTGVFTGPTVETFKRAIDVLSDKSATEFQLLAIPDMREPLVTDYAVTACESRFDAMFIMDILEYDQENSTILEESKLQHVGNIITAFSNRKLDTSFAAAYFPNVLSRRPSNNTPIQVPPSVCMLGVMSQNDTLADPWFAPAGLTRGRLNAINSKVQMNRDVLNDLYDADINPIYEPAGRAGQVYSFGQKTLLQNQSALDRINVRRLLINIRRKVKAIANTLLFEPNRASTLARFSSLVEPIMADVQARQGVERYKVQIDTSTTTQNDVENNTIRGKIYLQPTKSVEFISLDFVVTNSID